MKKVSVIIPCYNTAKLLPRCFISLAMQTIGAENLELIFVNDASTDDGATWNALCELEKLLPDSVMVINLQENLRQGGARNVGLLYASGEYVSFVDSDDEVELDMYEKAYNRAKEHDADLLQFNHKYCLNQKEKIPAARQMADEVIVIHSDEERKAMLLSEKISYGCCNKLYRKALLDEAQVQFPEHVVYEEPLFVYPLFYYANRFVTMSDHLYIYHKNLQGTSFHDMQEFSTLYQHTDVQLAVWNFMKQTPYFETFYEEIKVYFLHTYLYEFLAFAKDRNMKVTLKDFLPLAETALREVPEIDQSAYANIVSEQMKIYRLIKEGIPEESFQELFENLVT